MNLRKFFSRFKRTSIEDAQQLAADLQGEHTVASVMQDFYARQAASLDPTNGVDHWTYAEVRQKQLDAQADQAHLARAVDEAQARLQAAIQAQQTPGERTLELRIVGKTNAAPLSTSPEPR